MIWPILKHPVIASLVLIAPVACAGASATAADLKLYWSDIHNQTIQRSNLDGSEIEDLVTGVVARGIAVDSVEGKLYWTESETLRIRRSNLDGSGSQEILQFGDGILRGIMVDEVNRRLYWTDHDGRIQRSTLAGENVETVVDTLSLPFALGIDHAAGKLYWSDWGTDKIQRANLDGTAVEDLVTTSVATLVSPRGLSLDVVAGKMYWVDAGAGLLYEAGLNGTGAAPLLVAGLTNPRFLALDPGERTLYWADLDLGRIRRVEIDSPESIDDVVIGLGMPFGVALGPEVAQCGDGAVQPAECCDLAGQNGVQGSGCSATCGCTGVCTVSRTSCATSSDCPPGEGCCGNSIHEPGEQCDDGNLEGRDCCSPTCQTEPSTSCTPSLCAELGIFGPHVLPASEKQLRINDAKLDGTMEKWSNSGDFNLFSGRTMDPSTERVVIGFSENDGTNGRNELHRVTLEPDACAPAAACFAANKQNTTWRYRDQRRSQDVAGACGFDAGVFRKSSGNKMKFQLKGKSDAADQCSYEFPAPAGTLIREDIVVGDECATVLLRCRVFGGNKTYRCVPEG